MEIYCYAMAGVVIWFLLTKRIQPTRAFMQAWPSLLFLSLNLLWIAFQSAPLPVEIVNVLSPHASALHATVSQAPATFSSLSLDPHATFIQFQKGAALLIIFCLTLILIDSAKKLRWLLYIVLLSGLFQAVYGSLMVLSGLEYTFLIKKISYIGDATGTFINRNHLAGYLEMSLAVGIGLMLSHLSSNRLHGWRAYSRHTIEILLGPKARIRLILIAMCIALVLTHSRMGNSAFFSTLLIVSSVYLFLCRHKSRSTIIFISSIIILDLLIVSSWFGLQKVIERLEHTSYAHETRDEVVRDTWVMIQDYPLTGTGAGNFFSTYPMYRQSDVHGYYDMAHNDYLQFLSEQGIIGTLPLVLAVLFAYFTIFRTLRTRHSSLMLGTAYASCFGLTAILIHSSVDFNLQIPANAALFMILLALPFISLHLGSRSTTRPVHQDLARHAAKNGFPIRFRQQLTNRFQLFKAQQQYFQPWRMHLKSINT